MKYEVHISAEVGLIVEPRNVVEEIPGVGIAFGRQAGSLFLRTDDLMQADHVCQVHARTARRCDDDIAWILFTDDGTASYATGQS